MDLALVSQKLAPSMRAEHESDHLLVVLSLQKSGIGPRRKPQYLLKYGKSDMGVMSKLGARKLTQEIRDRKPSSNHRGGNKKTKAALTDKWTMVKLWQTERSKPHPDLAINLEERTDVFKRVAGEAKDRQWKSFCDTLNSTTTLTHFWQFYQQMEGSAANINTPSPTDACGAVLKTSEEKGLALIQRFVQQNNPNNLDERKVVLKGLTEE